MTSTRAAAAHPILRPAGPADEPAIRDVHAQTCAEQFAALDPATRDALVRMQYDGQRAQYRAAYPGSVDSAVLVDGTVVGRAWTDLGDRALRLLDLAVLPAWRRRGIATTVLHTLMEQAVTAGVPLVLSVWQHNEPALRLYKGLDFLPVGATSSSGYVELSWVPAREVVL